MQLPSLPHFRGSAPAESQAQAAGWSSTGSKEPVPTSGLSTSFHPPSPPAFLPLFSPVLQFLLSAPGFQPWLLQHPPSHQAAPHSGMDFLTRPHLKQCLALTSALVGRIGGQRVPEEAVFAAVAVEAGGVVDALEALARPAVTVPNGVGLHVAIAPARLAGLGSRWVSKIAISTVLTVGPWERRDKEKLTLLHERQRLPRSLCPTDMGVFRPIRVGRTASPLSSPPRPSHGALVRLWKARCKDWPWSSSFLLVFFLFFCFPSSTPILFPSMLSV